MSLRLAFMGTPDFSLPLLDALVSAGHDIAAVYTRAPRPAGRGMEMRLSAVHARANDLGLPVLTPRSLKGEEMAEAFAGHRVDVAIVAAYGLLLPKAVLDAPRYGCLNLHGSLLPRWRGAAPLQRAIMAGDTASGVMVMRMEEGLDTGPVALTARTVIDDTMTGGQLHDVLAAAGASLMVEALTGLEVGTLRFTPQAEEGVTYAHKLGKSEGRIDWRAGPRVVHDLIRALAPSPGAFFEHDFGRGGERIKVLASLKEATRAAPGRLLDDALLVGCGDGAVRLTHVQRAGKAPMTAAEFLRGTRLVAGMQLDLP